MALITVRLGMVSPQGRDDIPFPASGRVEFVPATHGKYDGAFRTIETVNTSIVQGEMQEVELTPGAWKFTVYPIKGNPWPTVSFVLEEGMEEPVNVIDFAPDVVIDKISYVKGPKGDPGEPYTEYDSEWIDISESLMSGWSGEAYIRRVGKNVEFRVYGLNATDATGESVLEVPEGFTPSAPKSRGPRPLLHTATDPIILRNSFFSGPTLSVVGYSASDVLYGDSGWFTDDSEPTV